ncbi:MAG: Nif3-like dinuclear metal center hexameric protein [Bacteroidota bacterium]
MTLQDFQKEFERLAPPAIAWKGDNVGLQVGNAADRITNVMVALDATEEIVREAVRKRANLIVTHHPLIFHPLKSVTLSTRTGALITLLIEKRIHLYAAHTNLDSVRWGVNFSLATRLGLTDISVLSPVKDSLTKIVVFVPEQFVDPVAEAMHTAGAGTFTKYDHCSFRTAGTGTFRGMNDARPFLGTAGRLEKVNEVMLEMLCETWKVQSVLQAMKAVHPYEEIAYDIIPLANSNTEYGLGAIGELPKPLSEKGVLNLVKRKLNVAAVRYSSGKEKIKRIAVCGGSGSDYIQEAVVRGADAMITADVKYHTFQDTEGKILLVDAGHYETEHIVLPSLARTIGTIIHAEDKKSKIFITEHTTNPIRYY